jgi:leucyl aminopeptidase
MMKLSLVAGDISQQKCDLLLLPVFETDVKGGKNPLKALVAVDGALGGLLLEDAAEEELAGKSDQTLVLHTHDRIPAHRVALLGLGTRQKFDPEALRLAIGRGAKLAHKLHAERLAVAMPEVREIEACVQAIGEGLLLGAYRFDRYKSQDQKKGEKRQEIKEARVVLPVGMEKTKALSRALETASMIAEATNVTRDLVNEPANHLTPAILADAARRVAREGKLKVEVLGRERIEKLHMGMFLAVAQGSAQEPMLIHLSYEPSGKAAKQPALALVGKAITFDSGGLSLKPTESMHDMKNDMAGAAAVIAAMKVVAKIKPPFPVHAYMGACENMPSGSALKVGDVLASRSGKTVEVMNTDAEGRLVLADVLSWAAEQKPAALVDLATLTGACVVALGQHIIGAFGTDDATVWAVLEAAKTSGEEMWRMPLSELLRDGLKSDIADLKNVGERWGGSISAALFLKEFVGETPWVHLDIAGPATAVKDRGYLSKGATGTGVRTLVEWIRGRMRIGEPAEG